MPITEAVESASAVATETVKALGAQPAFLVVILLNALMVAGAAYYLTSVAEIRREEFRMVFSQCIGPPVPKPH